MIKRPALSSGAIERGGFGQSIPCLPDKRDDLRAWNEVVDVLLKTTNADDELLQPLREGSSVMSRILTPILASV
jgi:hypothetical protein